MRISNTRKTGGIGDTRGVGAIFKGIREIRSIRRTKRIFVIMMITVNMGFRDVRIMMITKKNYRLQILL